MRQTSIVGFPDTLKSLPQAEQKALQTALDQAASITNQAQQQSVLQAITAVVAVRRREQMQKGSNRRTAAGPPSPHRRPRPARSHERCVSEGNKFPFRPELMPWKRPACGTEPALGGSPSPLGQASVSGAGGLLPSPWFRQGPRRGSPFKRGRGRSARGRASRPVPRPRAGRAPGPPGSLSCGPSCGPGGQCRARPRGIIGAAPPGPAPLGPPWSLSATVVSGALRAFIGLFRLPLSLWRPGQGLRKWPQAATLDGAAATRCQPESLSNERSYKP